MISAAQGLTPRVSQSTNFFGQSERWGANGLVSLHSSATVAQALEQVEASGAAGSVCDGDLGELVD